MHLDEDFIRITCCLNKRTTGEPRSESRTETKMVKALGEEQVTADLRSEREISD